MLIQLQSLLILQLIVSVRGLLDQIYCFLLGKVGEKEVVLIHSAEMTSWDDITSYSCDCG